MNTLARPFHRATPAAAPQITKPLVLKYTDISVIAWCRSLDLAMRNPPALYNPLINNSHILVTDSEQQLFDNHMHCLRVLFLQYCNPSAEGIRGQVGDVDRRREYVDEFANTSPEMQTLPARLRPLRWDFDAVFGHLDWLPVNVVAEQKPVEQVTERIDTAALASAVIDSAEDAECPICIEHAGPEGLVKLQCCDHAFHLDCLDEWVNGPAGNAGLCPMCRKSISLAK